MRESGFVDVPGMDEHTSFLISGVLLDPDNAIPIRLPEDSVRSRINHTTRRMTGIIRLLKHNRAQK